MADESESPEESAAAPASSFAGAYMPAPFQNVLQNFNVNQIGSRTDLIFAFAFITVMAVLIIPMPRFMLDFSLALSITFSVLILMTALFIQKPLEFSAFPTVLLVATMLRLSLNVASTRLILSHGHEGTQAAGRVIEAFGHFVMGGNFVIGVIVFTILLIVNFIVITKGSSRIAEVSARFSLDAMPGKQMAIDSDLSAGLIDEKDAKKRRKELESETNFFGAMDGSAKFVRGDAIAGLLITLINIIGGIIIGVVQQKMNFSDAARSYLVLSVGDGLVTQVPALLVSTAAGMMVSKAGVEGSADKALFNQLSAYPAALGMSSVLSGFLALIPGLPILPFMSLSVLTGVGAWFANQQYAIRKQQEEYDEMVRNAERAAHGAKHSTPSTQTIQAPEYKDINLNTLASIDAIRLELGYGLLPLLDGTAESKGLSDQIKALRQQMLNEIGIILPSVRLQDNLQLSQFAYSIKVKEIEAASGELRPNSWLVMDPEAKPITLVGEDTIEPSFGLPAKWVDERVKAEAESLSYTIVEPVMVLATHLAEIVKDNIGEILSYTDVQKILDNISDSYKKLLNDIVPVNITVGGIQRVLQNLVTERVSIRDIGTILEGIAEATAFAKNTMTITEHVRYRLARQISFSHLDDFGMLSIISLSPEWEEAYQRSIVGDHDNRYIAMSPIESHLFMKNLGEEYDRLALMGEFPLLVTSSAIRPFVRSLTERVRPSIVVISHNEIHPKCKIRNLGSLKM
ncbi:MAG: flagellar biosynthesis protein FlhA [Proteobacteria bacterium]|nr:flagellar biosynthesis protein FlhA [Pseudomonadota bacterium]